MALAVYGSAYDMIQSHDLALSKKMLPLNTSLVASLYANEEADTTVSRGLHKKWHIKILSPSTINS